MSFIKNRLRAFGFAFSGLAAAFKTEVHLKLHAVATILVLFAGVYFSISKTEWCLVLLCIALVVSLELLNSAIEQLCNKLMPENNPTVKYIKDVSAAAVLVAAIVAFVCAGLIFWPYFSGS